MIGYNLICIENDKNNEEMKYFSEIKKYIDEYINTTVIISLLPLTDIVIVIGFNNQYNKHLDILFDEIFDLLNIKYKIYPLKISNNINIIFANCG